MGVITEIDMKNKIVNIPQVESKAKTHSVILMEDGSYQVQSGTTRNTYTVVVDPVIRCNCKWGQYTKSGIPTACSHSQAVVAEIASQSGYKAKARSEEAPLSSLKRKVLPHGNGVVFTLRLA